MTGRRQNRRDGFDFWQFVDELATIGLRLSWLVICAVVMFGGVYGLLFL